MSLDDKVSDSDQVYSSHGVKVIVDDQSLAYLQKATVKYIEENGRSGFAIEVDFYLIHFWIKPGAKTKLLDQTHQSTPTPR